MNDLAAESESKRVRSYCGRIIICLATFQALGATLKMPTHLEANDISRWCTVWALLERGTYQIDECPWQERTQDKVYKFSPFEPQTSSSIKHFYSSKPAFLPTIIAGLIYPARAITGVPLHHAVAQERVPRNVRKPDPAKPGEFMIVNETPPPVQWPAFVYYLKPMIVLFNVVPYAVALILFSRLLDRYAPNDWAWLIGLGAFAWGNPLFAFLTTLNNHTVAAYAAFFAIDALLAIWGRKDASPWRYVQAGFFGAFCACNELPAAVFGAALFFLALANDARSTVRYFIPAAAPVCLFFMATLYASTGGWKPFYAEFGTLSYTGYEWAYWNNPLEMDWYDNHPEHKGLYLFHMLLGHHGFFSLTPIFFYSLIGMTAAIRGRDASLRMLAVFTAVLSAGLLAFYTVKTNNYGGSTQGLRWLFWCMPLWLILVPAGLSRAEASRRTRVLSLLALGFSALTAGYALRMPWSHPWILDMMEHLGLLTLVR